MSVITARFLMRPVFHKFLKFRKVYRNFKDTEVYGWGSSMGGRSTFYYVAGLFLSQNFHHFNPTLAGPILDQARPSRILLRQSNSPESVVSESDEPDQLQVS